MEKKLLIIAEDPRIQQQMHKSFEADFLAEQSCDGLSGLLRAVEWKPDIIIIAYSLPKLNGIEVCEQIKKRTETLIIMVADRLSEDERAACFEAGADDVSHMADNCRELFYRINVHLRKSLSQDQYRIPNEESESIIHFGRLTMNKLTHKIHYEGEELMLTRKEFSILWSLTKKKNEVVSRNELLRIVWSYDYSGDDRMIDTHLNRIRKKMLTCSQDFVIKTVWGVGYKLERVANSDKLISKALL